MARPRRRPPLVLHGVIASAGFASGDRVVVGHWWRSPLGPFTDVMWAGPDGTRVLLAPDDAVVRFVTAIYRFERTEVVPIAVRSSDRSIEVTAGTRHVRLQAGRAVRFPTLPGGRRPRWLTRGVEGPIAHRLLGVRPYGTSPTGVREWYQAQSLRWVASAEAQVEGRDLGELRPVDPPVGVGFSEPPARPSMVRLHTLVDDPTGRLAALTGGGA